MKKAFLFLLLGIFSGGQALAANQVMCYTYDGSKLLLIV